MASAKARKPRLGKGLSSLMAQPVAVEAPKDSEVNPADSPAVESDVSVAESGLAGERLLHLPVAAISPNPHQPRQRFDEEALAQLAASIRAEGIMQPVVVRAVDDGYQLVAGERRWRAAQLANLDTLPAIIRELTDQQLAEWAIIENLQREDLNPIERAQAFDNLIKTHHLSHEDVARRIGVDRSSIANLLRLLSLTEDVRGWVADGLLSMGQARALVSLPDSQAQVAVARKAIEQEWSVRRVEEVVRSLQKDSGVGQASGSSMSGSRPTPSARPGASHFADLEQQLTRSLGTKVRIKRGRRKGAGTLSIDFYSVEQFDTLLNHLGVTLED